MILALTMHHDWEIEAFNFNSAYLNGKLGADEEIYMGELPGYKTQGTGSVKQLQKALYGLKQAGRKRYKALSDALTNLSFCVSHVDPGVFTAQVGIELLILTVYMDNCILMGSSEKLITQYKQKLNEQYALTDLGPVHWLFRIKVTYD